MHGARRVKELRVQISLVILNEFKRITSVLPEIIRKPKILGREEVNQFA